LTDQFAVRRQALPADFDQLSEFDIWALLQCIMRDLNTPGDSFIVAATHLLCLVLSRTTQQLQKILDSNTEDDPTQAPFFKKDQHIGLFIPHQNRWGNGQQRWSGRQGVRKSTALQTEHVRAHANICVLLMD